MARTRGRERDSGVPRRFYGEKIGEGNVIHGAAVKGACGVGVRKLVRANGLRFGLSGEYLILSLQTISFCASRPSF